MAGTKKTDNHYFADKVRLRIDHLPDVGDRPMRVLDCYGGTGLIWRAVERLAGVKIIRTAIDMRQDIEYAHIHGDNTKIIGGLNLQKFDIIDLDAYGVPYDLLKEVFPKFSCSVFVTFIQTMNGAMPHGLLNDIGISKEMANKASSLFNRRGFEYFTEWLAANGVTKINHRSKHRKHYLHFDLSDAVAP